MAEQKKKEVRNVTDTLKEYYDSQQWKYRYDAENGVFRMFIRLQAKDIDTCELRTVVRDEERFTTFVILPFKVPEKKRALAAKFISHVNYKLLLGCFEMDFHDGEIQYKTTCFCGNVRLDPRHIRRQVNVGVEMVEEYGPGLIAVLFEGRPMDEVLKRITRLREYRHGQYGRDK